VGHLSAVDFTPYRSFLTELAHASGAFIRPHFGRLDLAVEVKSDASPVTVADRGAEELMRGLIAKKFPAHVSDKIFSGIEQQAKVLAAG
jgi:myo-inositol-1(or 4)-monophosphatase